VFDEVFRLLTPERLLHDPRARGQGVRIAVIDTGVERALVEAKHRAQGVAIERIEGAIFSPASETPLPYEGHQSAPHGTTVADIILTIAPQARLFSADVFGPRGSCEVETLIKALHHAMEHWNCKIINLSLGVPEERLQQLQRRMQFLRAIEDAYYRDVLIFAAAHNEHPHTRSYPAIFAPPLISVDKRTFGTALEFAYELRHQIEFQAHSRGYIGPFVNEPATSWATPHLSGIAARILSLRPEMKPFEIKTVLYWLSKHYVKAHTNSA
jgi:subtilisin family serine protease